jgi:hypothetical protein
VSSLTQALFDQSFYWIKSRKKTTREFYQLNDQLTEEQVIENVAKQLHHMFYVKKKFLAENNLTTTTKVPL